MLPAAPDLGHQVQSYLDSHRCLVVLDAYDAVEPDIEALYFLNRFGRLGRAPGRVLVTTQRQLFLQSETVVEVGEARDLGLELTIFPVEDGMHLVEADGENCGDADLREFSGGDRSSRIFGDPVSYGRRLFEAVFRDGSPARRRLDALPSEPFHPAARILIVAEDREAQAVAWEYLHDGRRYLASEYQFARGITRARRRACGRQRAAGAVPVLVVPSNPLIHNGLPVRELDLERELGFLRSAVLESEQQFEVKTLRPATLEAMQEHLAGLASPAVLYFMGHGWMDSGGAYLLFEDETGVGVQASAEDVARITGGRVAISVLNSCESAAVPDYSASAIGLQLCLGGVPYALGMQASPPESVSLLFSRIFCRYLFSGNPVEEALRQARLSLLTSPDGDQRGYAAGLPVLYTSLSRGSISLGAAPGKAAISDMQPPMEFDPPIRAAERFRGRRAELVEIGRRLREGARVIVLLGPAAVGKSALAREAAARFSWRFPDGLFGISLERPPSRDYLVSRLARLMGLVGRDYLLEELERAVIKTFRTSRMLLVLDNFESLLAHTSQDSVADLTGLIRSLAAEKGNGVLLITTQDSAVGLAGAAEPLQISGLDRIAALEVFWDHAQRRFGSMERSALDRFREAEREGSLGWWLGRFDSSPVGQLTGAVERHPLAVALLAETYDSGQDSLQEVVEFWKRNLGVSALPKLGLRPLAACFECAYRKLPDDCRELLLHLVCFQAPFSADAAASVLGVPREEVVARLDRLARSSLLERQESPAPYFLSPVVRWFCEQRPPTGQLEDARRRMARYYLGFLRDASQRIDSAQASVASMILPDLRRGPDLLSGGERSEYSLHLGRLLLGFGELEAAAGLYETALAAQDSDARQTARALLATAHVYLDLGKGDEAALACEKVLERFVDDHELRAEALHAKGRIAQARGDLDEALGLHGESVQSWERCNQQQGIAIALHEMAYVHRAKGQLYLAGECCQRALEIDRELGNDHDRATVLHQQAGILAARGDFNGALRLFGECLALREQVHDRQGRAASQLEMASLHCARGELATALELCEEVLEVEREIGYRQTQAAALHCRGHIREILGDPASARADYCESVRIKAAMRDELGLAATFRALGHLSARQGLLTSAKESFRDALEIADRLKASSARAEALLGLAHLHRICGDLGLARQFYEDAGREAERAGNEQCRAACLEGFGYVARVHGHFDEAARCYEESLGIWERAGSLRGRARLLHEMGGIEVVRGEMDRALANYDESLALWRQSGDVCSRALTLHQVAYIRRVRGELDEAVRLCRESLQLDDRLDDRQARAATLHSIAWVHLARGQFAAAGEMLQCALQINRELGNRKAEAAVLTSTGALRRLEERLEDAADLFDDSLRIRHEISDVPGQIATRIERANLAQTCGKPHDALNQFEGCLKDAENLGDVPLVLAAWQGIAAALLRLGRHGEAETASERGLKVAQRMGDVAASAALRVVRGSCLSLRGQSPSALHELLDAFFDLNRMGIAAVEDVATLLGEWEGTAGTGFESLLLAAAGNREMPEWFEIWRRNPRRGRLVRLERMAETEESGDLQSAIATYLQAIAVVEACEGLKQDVACRLGLEKRLAECCLRVGQHARALEHLEFVHRNCLLTSDVEGMIEAIRGITRVHVAAKDADRALLSLREEYHLGERSGRLDVAIRAAEEAASFSVSRGHVGEAFKDLRRALQLLRRNGDRENAQRVYAKVKAIRRPAGRAFPAAVSSADGTSMTARFLRYAPSTPRLRDAIAVLSQLDSEGLETAIWDRLAGTSSGQRLGRLGREEEPADIFVDLMLDDPREGWRRLIGETCSRLLRRESLGRMAQADALSALCYVAASSGWVNLHMVMALQRICERQRSEHTLLANGETLLSGALRALVGAIPRCPDSKTAAGLFDLLEGLRAEPELRLLALCGLICLLPDRKRTYRDTLDEPGRQQLDLALEWVGFGAPVGASPGTQAVSQGLAAGAAGGWD